MSDGARESMFVRGLRAEGCCETYLNSISSANESLVERTVQTPWKHAIELWRMIGSRRWNLFGVLFAGKRWRPSDLSDARNELSHRHPRWLPHDERFGGRVNRAVGTMAL